MIYLLSAALIPTEQYLTVKCSVRYDGAKHKTIIEPTKRKKVRTVDFGDTLTAILKKARKEKRTSARLLDKVAGND